MISARSHSITAGANNLPIHSTIRVITHSVNQFEKREKVLRLLHTRLVSPSRRVLAPSSTILGHSLFSMYFEVLERVEYVALQRQCFATVRATRTLAQARETRCRRLHRTMMVDDCGLLEVGSFSKR